MKKSFNRLSDIPMSLIQIRNDVHSCHINDGWFNQKHIIVFSTFFFFSITQLINCEETSGHRIYIEKICCIF